MGQMASNLGNSNVTDPKQAQWGDLDGSEKGARVAAGGMQGLAKGMQSMAPGQPGNGGGPTMNPLGFGQPQAQGQSFIPKMKDPFYGA